MRKPILLISTAALALLAIGSAPRYLEELRIGGGFNESVDGGADFERDGDIFTNGAIAAGSAGQSRGMLRLHYGPNGNTPGALEFDSPTGTPWYLFSSDTGALRLHSSLPTSNTDGAPLARLNAAETLVANWANTAYPWADNEVADNLTLSGGTVNNAAIGAATPSTGAFTSISATGQATFGIVDATAGLVTVEGGSVDPSELRIANPADEDTVVDYYTFRSGALTGGLQIGAYGGSGPIGQIVMFDGSNGKTYLTGDLDVNGGDIGTSSDSDLLGLAANSLTIRGRFASSVITTVAANDTSPSVSAGNFFKIPNTWTAGNNITTFDNGAVGQHITLIGGDSDCTVVDGSNLKLSANWTAAANATLHLAFDGADWFELSRSTN